MAIVVNDPGDKRYSMSLTAKKRVIEALDKYIEDHKTPFASIDRITVTEGLLTEFLTKTGYLQ